ncbi:MAG: sulfur carrier protein ThiS [Bacteroidales bacterium]|nr:sulfur carrier protein ThiS [Bacteroidales bacterium]
MMEITLNNRKEIFDTESMTVAEMLEIKSFTFRMRMVKINGKLIKKDQYSTTVIKNGDDVKMLYLMSGG